jgi:hypothetical protein
MIHAQKLPTFNSHSRRCLPRWNPCIRSPRFTIFSAIEGHNWHTRRMYKLYCDRGRSTGGGALSASRGWWWGRGWLRGGRHHKVGGQDGVAVEGQCVSSSSLGQRGKLWVSDRPPVRCVSLGQQSTPFKSNGPFTTTATP